MRKSPVARHRTAVLAILTVGAVAYLEVHRNWGSGQPVSAGALLLLCVLVAVLVALVALHIADPFSVHTDESVR